MTKKKTQADRPDEGQPLPIPSGAARRRLLRALGGSGGAALGVLLAPQWQKPVVKAVVLPAHAQTSPVEAVGCLITVLANVEGIVFASGTDGTMQFFVEDGGGSTELGSVLVPSEATSASLLASSTFPPGSYGVTAGLTRPGNSSQAWTVNWSCCVPGGSRSRAFGGSSDQLGLIAEVSDDGECELLFPL